MFIFYSASAFKMWDFEGSRFNTNMTSANFNSCLFVIPGLFFLSQERLQFRHLQIHDKNEKGDQVKDDKEYNHKECGGKVTEQLP